MSTPLPFRRSLAIPALILLGLTPGCGDDTTVVDRCDGGLTDCDGICVDSLYDPNNCGACGNACEGDLFCDAGTCSDTCSDGFEVCDGVCVNPEYDPDNCGECGLSCGAGLVCDGGTCADSCGPGTEQCGDRCIDTQIDPMHCGGCDIACGSAETCVAGSCVPPVCTAPEQLCGDECIDTTSSQEHCGACDNPCGADEFCIASNCEPASPLGLIQTSGEDRAIGHDLYVLRDVVFDLVPLNGMSFNGETVASYRVLPDDSVVYVAAQDAEGQRELYHQPVAPVSPTKLNPALAADVDIEADIVVNAAGDTVFYRANADASDTVDLYSVAIANPGVATKLSDAQITGGDVLGGVTVTDDGTRAAYLADQDNDDLTEVYMVDVASPGNSTKLSAPPSGEVWDAKISPDGSAIAYRESEFELNLYVGLTSAPGNVAQAPVDGGEGGGSTWGYNFTGDSAQLLYATSSFGTGELRSIPPSSPNTLTIVAAIDNYIAGDFAITSDDSTAIFRGGSNGQLFAASLTTAVFPTTLTPQFDAGGFISSFTLGPDDDTIAFVVNGDEANITPGFEPAIPPQNLGDAAYTVSVSSPGVVTRISQMDGGESVAPGFGISPTGSHILYRADHDADGAIEAHLVDLSTLEAQEVSPALQNAETEIREVATTADGSSVYFIADLNDYRRYELYRTDLATPGTAIKISAQMPTGADVDAFALSADGSALVYRADPDLTDVQELYYVSTATPGAATKVNVPASPDNGEIGQFRISADGGYVSYIEFSTAGATLRGTASTNLGSSTLLNGPILTDVVDHELSSDGSRIFYLASQDTLFATELYTALVADPQNTNVRMNTPAPDGSFDVYAGIELLSDDATVIYRGDLESNSRDRLYRSTVGTPATSELLSVPEVPNNGDVLSFKISPDGSFLVYRGDTENDQSFDLFHVDLGAAVLPASTKLNQNSPSSVTDVEDYVIRPDSLQVAYRMDPTSGFEIFAADVSPIAPPVRISSALAGNNGGLDQGLSYTGDGTGLMYLGNILGGNLRHVYYTELSAPGISHLVHQGVSLESNLLAGAAGATGLVVSYPHHDSEAVYLIGGPNPGDTQLFSPWRGASDVKAVSAY